jgi:hypothetical protein
MSLTCDVCGTSDLPGGLGACAHGRGCTVCPDCLCNKCDSIDQCPKHCNCEDEEDSIESSNGSPSEDE